MMNWGQGWSVGTGGAAVAAPPAGVQGNLAISGGVGGGAGGQAGVVALILILGGLVVLYTQTRGIQGIR
jgi:hypothetical protein